MKYRNDLPGFVILYHPYLNQYYVGASASIEEYVYHMRRLLVHTPQRYFKDAHAVMHVDVRIYRTETHDLAKKARNMLLANDKLDQLEVFVNRYRRIKARTMGYKVSRRIPTKRVDASPPE